MKKTRLIIIIVIITFISGFYATGAHEHLKLEAIQTNLDRIRGYYQERPAMIVGLFLGVYIFLTSLSIPGAIVLTLLAGAIFGVGNGTLLVSVASTAGASIAFLMSRYLFRESMMKKFERKLRKINRKLEQNGNLYLFTLRLIPVSPYVVVNILMGLTSVRLWTFIWITFLGMLPGNMIYVFAGRKIADIRSASEILTWPIILSLTLIGILPLVTTKIGRLISDQKSRTQEEA